MYVRPRLSVARRTMEDAETGPDTDQNMRVTGQQEVQCELQGDNRRRLSYERGISGRSACHDAGVLSMELL
jgi:hypothetical protein